MLKAHRIGLYYVLQDLSKTMRYTASKPWPPSVPLTLIAAEEILPLFPNDEKKNTAAQTKWVNCLKTFGAAENRRYVLAKKAGHKVWADNPTLVVSKNKRQIRQK